MIRGVYETIEGIVFDAAVAVTIPVLIWWVNHGLRREELSDELRQFWEGRSASA